MAKGLMDMDGSMLIAGREWGTRKINGNEKIQEK